MVVETAIIMPFFVFLMLGLLQLSLLHQARVLAKYASYKAVRVGSIHNAKISSMKRAALAVLLPMTGRRSAESFYNATTDNYNASWNSANGKNESGNVNDKLVDVTICEPYGSVGGDFDDPKGAMGVSPGSGWKDFNNGRLMIQVTFYHQMVIPFANSVLWHIVAGQERAETMRVLRMLPEADDAKKQKFETKRTINDLQGLADASPPIYVMPIRASWSMRMMSNFLSRGNADFKLPAKNECKVPWK